MVKSAMENGENKIETNLHSKVAASSDVDFVEYSTGVSGLSDMIPPTQMKSIYGACNFMLEWLWNPEIRGSTKTPEGDGFYLFGKKNLLWPGKVMGSEDYNAIVVENLAKDKTKSDMDLEVIFVILRPKQKREWKSMDTNRKRRDLLKLWYTETNNGGIWDPSEKNAYVDTATIPELDIYSSDPNMEELAGANLGADYRVAVASESCTLQLNQMGGKATSEVKMVALKGLDMSEKSGLKIDFDFRKEQDGFLIFLQGTTPGVPDLHPKHLLSGYIYREN